MFRRLRMSQRLGIPLLALLLITGCAPVVIPVSVSTGVPTAGAAATVPLPVATVAATATTRSVVPTSAPAGTATPATSRAVHIAVQAPDKSIKLVALNGHMMPLAAAGVAFEVGRADRALGETIYALSSSAPPGVYAIDTLGIRRVGFMPATFYGFAVNPHGSPALAWGTGTLGPATNVEIVSSALDGSSRRSLIRDSFGGEPRVLRPLVFADDGHALYYGREPVGLGGYILFGGLSNVWSLNLNDGKATELLSEKRAGGTACIDSLASTLAATHCERQSIQILDLANPSQPARVIRPPSNLVFAQIGSATFNPAGTRVAYAVARGDASNEQGWLLVSDGLSGASKVLGVSQPNEYFNVLTWLDADTVVVQSLSTAAPVPSGAVWAANVNGDGLTKLADGTFLALLPGAQQ